MSNPLSPLEGDELPAEILDNALSSGGYPYEDRMDKKQYEEELKTLQIELAKLQKSIETTGDRILMIFEGRDAAGKGGTIKAFMEYLNPRKAHIVALAKPTERERGQWYFQRYVAHLPTAGEMALFDRSWYNRAGVERVMGFCTKDQYEKFYQEVPAFEKILVRDGVKLFKFWLTIGREQQLKRFHSRKIDPLRKWKLSPMDIAAVEKWDEYSKARDAMLKHTHTDMAPWTTIKANDKRRSRLNAIRKLLLGVEYEGKDLEKIGSLDPKIITSGSDDIA